MHIDENLLPVDFPSARVMGSLSEAFARPFSAGENLRIVPASLSGDFDAIARRLAIVTGNTGRYDSDLPISQRHGYFGLGKEFLIKNWPLLKARGMGLGSMARDEKRAFDTIVDDMDRSISLGAHPLLRIIYAEQESLHADPGPCVFLRSYNHAGTKYIRDRDSLKKQFLGNRNREASDERYQMPLGWYSLHLSKDAPLKNSCEVKFPSVHTSPKKEPSDTPRLLKISKCDLAGSFGHRIYSPK